MFSSLSTTLMNFLPKIHNVLNFYYYFIIKFYLTQFKFICNVLCSFGYKQGLIVILNLENNK